MAKTIRLASGGYVTRAWAGDAFRFEVEGVTPDPHSVQTILRPTRSEMLAIASLFRRAAMKLGKGGEREVYEAPTLKVVCGTSRGHVGLWCTRGLNHPGDCLLINLPCLSG